MKNETGRPETPVGWIPIMRGFALHYRHVCRMVALWICLIQTGYGAGPVQLIGPPRVMVSGNKAVLQWTTDRETGTSVLYGPAVERPTRRFKGKVGKEHWAELDGLEPATRYRLVLGTARDPLQTNEFVTPPRESPTATWVALTVILAPPRLSNSTNSVEPPSAAIRGKNPVTDPEVLRSTSLPQPPPLKETWGHPETVSDHFRRHGADFHARDPEDYAAQAWRFRRIAASAGFPAKKDAKGILRIYDPSSDTFGAYNPDGTTRTFFKPGNKTYFERQPGKSVVLHE